MRTQPLTVPGSGVYMPFHMESAKTGSQPQTIGWNESWAENLPWGMFALLHQGQKTPYQLHQLISLRDQLTLTIKMIDKILSDHKYTTTPITWDWERVFPASRDLELYWEKPLAETSSSHIESDEKLDTTAEVMSAYAAISKANLHRQWFSSPLNDEIQAALNSFESGIDGIRPSVPVVQMAWRLAREIARSVNVPDITLDVDGELSFYLRLGNGHLIMAELTVYGTIDASIYDEDDRLLHRLRRATEEEFISALSV